jgi:hypothetical protein
MSQLSGSLGKYRGVLPEGILNWLVPYRHTPSVTVTSRYPRHLLSSTTSPLIHTPKTAYPLFPSLVAEEPQEMEGVQVVRANIDDTAVEHFRIIEHHPLMELFVYNMKTLFFRI